MTQAAKMTQLAIAALEDKKAEDITLIDIAKVSVLADYFLIANGNNRNQVQAMADNVDEQLTKAGYSFKEASALDQVKNCKKPMLFIHGTADDFIPYEMMDILYQAKPGNNKEKITAPGAGHGEAMYLLGEEYWDDVFTFLE